MSLKQNKKKVMKLLEQLDWMFSVQNLDRSIIFKEEDDAILDDPMCCQIVYNEPYQKVTLYVYPVFFTRDLSEQRKILLHELAHTITIPLNRVATDLHDGKLHTPEQIRNAHERATSKIDNILDRLLTGGMRYAKDAYKEYVR